MGEIAGERCRLSVVVPTRDRRDLVVAHVRALERQEIGEPFEVIVVVDGSVDGTAAALRELAPRFPLRALEQPPRGAAAARNRGASEARGEILLFLDDDMEADPDLLAWHDRRHREGADVVLGHLPLHPDSPRNFLSAGVGRWAELRCRVLEKSAAAVPGREVRTGQLSVRRELFRRVGGFDVEFTRGGSFGGEDVDFGERLERASARIVFEPRAISRQLYVVDFRTLIDRKRWLGRADVLLARKHAVRNAEASGWRERARDRWIGRWVWPLLRRPIFSLLEAGIESRWLTRAFFGLGGSTYARGIREAGGFPCARELVVLAYHAVRDLAGAPVLESYGVPPSRLRRQLERLRSLGFRFASPDELVRLVREGRPVQRRAVFLTFDDAYVDQLTAALPLLEALDAPAVVFAPSALVGATNRWDERLGAPSLRLCDAGELRELAARGVEIGSHGRTHRRLDRLDDGELRDELARSADELEAIGLPRPRLLSYPHGVVDERVRSATAEAGYAAAFTVRPGGVTAASEPFELPRIEVHRRDGPARLLAKILRARRAGDTSRR